ncbi:MAG: heavy metal translocating P-type ATPase [Syntrophales bacterium]
MGRCGHCLSEFPDNDAIEDDADGQRRVFCCVGCRSVYRLIHREGLGRFYERRRWEGGGPPVPSAAAGIDCSSFAGGVRLGEGKTEIDLLIEGIRCASCVWLNERMLERLPGVEYVRISYATHRARIRWDPKRVDLGRILGRIASVGYQPKPWSESEQFRERTAERRDLLVRFGTAAFLSLQLMMVSTALYAGYFQGIDGTVKFTFETISLLLTLPVFLYAGRPFIAGALASLGRLRFTMDSLVTLGAGSAFACSLIALFTGGEVYFDTAAMIITLVLLGRLIEATARGKASDTIERLAGLRPREARVIRDGTRHRVPLESVVPGDLVEVVPGERIPLDGVVRSGCSEADESLLTGEARPVPKGEGSRVIGGSMNLYGAFVLEVDRRGTEGVLAGIIRAVEEAQERRPRIQTAAERVVGYAVPAVLAAALAAVFFHLLNGAPPERALMIGIAVLVITCPCSLGLATPLALMMFASRASAMGILVKSGETAEQAGKTGRVVFDKTGTITVGRPRLHETVVLDRSFSPAEIVALAGAVEGQSEHSIGQALAAAARGLPGRRAPAAVAEFRATPGRGVSATVGERRVVIGNRSWLRENGIPVDGDAVGAGVAGPHEQEGSTVVYLGWEGALRAILVVSDGIREEAAAVIAELKALCCAVSIVSGDNERTTRAVARGVGIDDAVWGASPAAKKEIIAHLQADGTRVMMVGDGINDAPALVQATTGVAMGRGSDIALESADVVLMRNDLALIPACIRLSRKTVAVIRQNIFWAFFYNAAALPLAFSGLLHPVVAAGAMAVSSLFVAGNSLRIGRGGKAEHASDKRASLRQQAGGYAAGPGGASVPAGGSLGGGAGETSAGAGAGTGTGAVTAATAGSAPFQPR